MNEAKKERDHQYYSFLSRFTLTVLEASKSGCVCSRARINVYTGLPRKHGNNNRTLKKTIRTIEKTIKMQKEIQGKEIKCYYLMLLLLLLLILI